jgi:DNA invertase Pin-like site-specific DNA recombinase
VKIGYARTSTTEQQAGFDAQTRDLATAGCERVFKEQVSAMGQRPELEAALDFIREGDTLLVTRLDRLARSTRHLLEIADRVKRKRAALNVVNLGMDTSTATGELLFTVIGAIAQFERQLLLERQREGIAAAKEAGRYKGRAPTARRQADQVRELAATGVEKATIAKRLGISRASVYRCLAIAFASG